LRKEELIDITYEALLELIKPHVKLPADASVKSVFINYQADIVSIKISSSDYPVVAEGSDNIRYVIDGKLRTNFNLRG